jgi:hypothetical protein
MRFAATRQDRGEYQRNRLGRNQRVAVAPNTKFTKCNELEDHLAGDLQRRQQAQN